jgi:hypothetical protein
MIGDEGYPHQLWYYRVCGVSLHLPFPVPSGVTSCSPHFGRPAFLRGGQARECPDCPPGGRSSQVAGILGNRGMIVAGKVSLYRKTSTGILVKRVAGRRIRDSPFCGAPGRSGPDRVSR